MPVIRKIIHIDMDAFFASVEQRDFPEYRGKAIAVGGSGKRGVVSTASYEARKYGVHSAMAGSVALRKCPFLIFVEPHFEAYKKVSKQIREIFFEYTDLVEPLSLDEAFLDVTENKKNNPSASLIAKEIQQRIFAETGLTASAGVSYNKFLAKIASDFRKPAGFTLIKPAEALDFLEKLPVEKFFGVGKVTAARMHRLNIFTGKDLKEKSESELRRIFGKSGGYYYQIVRGIDHRSVETDRIRKSIAAERTFEEDIISPDMLKVKLSEIGQILYERCRKSNVFGRTLSIKIKFSDFKQITRSRTLPYPVDSAEMIHTEAFIIFDSVDFENRAVRLLGLSLTNFEISEHGKPIQLSFNFKK
jgi:DNA polymerase-4